jgi:PadR family transcriptional regulator PadR
MNFKTDLDAVILAALQGRSLHGYEISKHIAAKSDGLVKIGEGRLYPALHKLELEGLVTAEWFLQEGKPSRKVYSLTTAGAARLVEKRQAWEKFTAGIGSILALPKGAQGG